MSVTCMTSRTPTKRNLIEIGPVKKHPKDFSLINMVSKHKAIILLAFTLFLGYFFILIPYRHWVANAVTKLVSRDIFLEKSPLVAKVTNHPLLLISTSTKQMSLTKYYKTTNTTTVPKTTTINRITTSTVRKSTTNTTPIPGVNMTTSKTTTEAAISKINRTISETDAQTTTKKAILQSSVTKAIRQTTSSKASIVTTTKTITPTSVTELQRQYWIMAKSGSRFHWTHNSLSDYENPLWITHLQSWGSVVMTLQNCVITCQGVYVSQMSFPELLVWIRMNDVIETTRVLLPSRPAVIAVPSKFYNKSIRIHVKLFLPLSNCTNVFMAENWTPQNHGPCSGNEKLITSLQRDDITLCEGYSPDQKGFHIKGDAVSSHLDTCQFVNGREEGQWWSFSKRFEPNFGKCSLDRKASTKLMSASSNFSALFIGDSEIRSSYQAVLGRWCPQWDLFDFKRVNSNGIDCKKEYRENYNVCGGSLRTMLRNICSTTIRGGAIWQSHDHAHTVAYVASISCGDTSYWQDRAVHKHWKFVDPGGTFNFGYYDVVVVGSALHDAKIPLEEYEKCSHRKLKFIRSWYKGPILMVGAWAAAAEKRPNSWKWEGNVQKTNAMDQVDEEIVKKTDGAWHLSLLNPTLNERFGTRDGVHLLWEHPISQVADILWHNMAVLVSH